MDGPEEHGGQQGCSGELLKVGSSQGLYSKLLINPKQRNKNAHSSPIMRMPRSNILDRVQNFLPQMAQANEKLAKEMEASPVAAFDIEHIEDQEKIIEMNVALVELSSSDSDEEESSSDEISDSDTEGEVTEQNIRLTPKVKKGKIEVLKASSELN